MKFSSALRAVHLFLIRGDGPITVHMNRKDEAYTGYPTGVFPKVKDSAQPKVAKRGDQGDAAIGSTSAVNGTELPPPPPAASTWKARDFVLGLQTREQGKDVTIYLDLDEVVGITGEKESS